MTDSLVKFDLFWLLVVPYYHTSFFCAFANMRSPADVSAWPAASRETVLSLSCSSSEDEAEVEVEGEEGEAEFDEGEGADAVAGGDVRPRTPAEEASLRVALEREAGDAAAARCVALAAEDATGLFNFFPSFLLTRRRSGDARAAEAAYTRAVALCGFGGAGGEGAEAAPSQRDLAKALLSRASFRLRLRRFADAADDASAAARAAPGAPSPLLKLAAALQVRRSPPQNTNTPPFFFPQLLTL